MKQYLNDAVVWLKNIADDNMALFALLAFFSTIVFVFLHISIAFSSHASGFMASFYLSSLLLLYKTFDAANRTAKAAEGAEKPYVYFTVEPQFIRKKNKAFRKNPKERRICVVCKLKNYGKSPATSVRFDLALDAIDPDSSTYAFGRGGDSAQELVLGAGKGITFILPDFEILFYWHEGEPPIHYLIRGVYSYANASGTMLEQDKTVYFKVFPTAAMEQMEWLKLNVAELTSEQYKEYCKENVKNRKKAPSS